MIGLMHVYWDGDEWVERGLIPWFPDWETAIAYARHRLKADPMLDDDDAFWLIEEDDNETRIIRRFKRKEVPMTIEDEVRQSCAHRLCWIPDRCCGTIRCRHEEWCDEFEKEVKSLERENWKSHRPCHD